MYRLVSFLLLREKRSLISDKIRARTKFTPLRVRLAQIMSKFLTHMPLKCVWAQLYHTYEPPTSVIVTLISL